MSEYCIKTKNQKEHDSVCYLLEKYGYKAHGNESAAWYIKNYGRKMEHPCVFIQPENLYWCGVGTPAGREEINLTQLLEILNQPTPEIVRLSNTYTAVITRDGIKVDCTIIPWETYDKIVSAVNKVRES